MDVIVAGVGNVLRGDDGFGVAVAERLVEKPLPSGVQVLDIGIGGIHLVQELMRVVDVLVVVDAVDLERPPGTVLVIQPEVGEFESLDDMADMHYATPERAFKLAKGLGVLPVSTWIVGCQPVDADSPVRGLSPRVEAAVEVASAEVRRLVSSLGVAWS